MEKVKMTPKQCEALYLKAHYAGVEAAKAHTPTPMVVQAIGANGQVIKTYEPVMGGVCGFAWINIYPARGQFITYLKNHQIGGSAYGGGYQIWVSQYQQSMELKEKYAQAFANVLQEAGLTAYAGSRMD